MTRRRKLTIAVGTGAVVLAVAGVGVAGAIAPAGPFSADDEAQAVLDDAAAQLGVEPAELSDALRQAYENRIEEAVDDGRLTEEQAERLEERLDENEVPFLFGLGGFHGLHGHGFGFHGRGDGPGILDEAAAYLDMTREELREALRDSTLAEIAAERGKTVAGLVHALVATQVKRIDEAVDAGKLSDEQAAELKQELEERTEAFVDGELRRPGSGGHHFWHGSGSPRGPPRLHGPRA